MSESQPDGDVEEEQSDDVDVDDNIKQRVKESQGCDSCDTPEEEMMVVYDRNKDYPWKEGNPYARQCPECGSKTFTSKSYWESQEVPHVIPKGEDEPLPLYQCPYPNCDGEFAGEQKACPECGGELIWEDDA